MTSFMILRYTPFHQRALFHRITNRQKSSGTQLVSSMEIAKAKQKLNKNDWVSYGFDYKSQTEDYNAHHSTFLLSVTLCLVFGGFCWAYAPDVHMRDWAQREAFLELYRREKGKQPLISPNFVDSMKLPTEKELCDLPIVV